MLKGGKAGWNTQLCYKECIWKKHWKLSGSSNTKAATSWFHKRYEGPPTLRKSSEDTVWVHTAARQVPTCMNSAQPLHTSLRRAALVRDAPAQKKLGAKAFSPLKSSMGLCSTSLSGLEKTTLPNAFWEEKELTQKTLRLEEQLCPIKSDSYWD